MENPMQTPPLAECRTNTHDQCGKAGSQPHNSQGASEFENGGPKVAAPDAKDDASKRPREPSSDESEGERPKKFRAIFPMKANKIDELRSCIVQPEKITTTFADVHIDSCTIEAVENVTLAMHHPDAFGYGILSRCASQSVLLYGPPGTGKTLLVRALAKQASSKILAISGADINSKYVGTGEKKIKDMFALARREYPCIIFIDEADAIFRSRSAEVRQSHQQYLNEFLVGMDGINSGGFTNPVVVAATNRPFDIDEGILRRLGRRIMVDIPNVAAREQILKIHLKGESLADDVDLFELARATPDYTGSDLKNLVYSAAITALREEMSAARGLSSPPGSTPESTGSQIGSSRVLRRAHFLHAKREIPPSPISDTVAKIRQFHNKFGDTVQKRSGEGPVDKTKSSVA